MVGFQRAAAVAEEQLARFGEIRRQRHIHQTRLTVDEGLGHACYRFGTQRAVSANQAQLAGTLGDQHAAIRQKRQ